MIKSVLAVYVGLTVWPCARVEGQALDRVAFQSNRDADLDSPKVQWNWEIYSIGVDGSDPINLTNRSARDIDPAWSPDGSRIAFASDRTGSFQIYVMGPDGENQVQLTRGPGNHVWPAWSPDGLQVAYSSNEMGEYDLYTMEADGRDPVNITQSAGPDYSPSWSPDGTQIAFISNRDRPASPVTGLEYGPGGVALWIRPGDVFIMDAVGGSATNLTIMDDVWSPLVPEDTGVFRNSSPVWSPDGERIAYLYDLITRPFRNREDIMLIDGTGGGHETLGLEPLYSLRTVSWAPDMSQLAFSGETSSGVDVFVVASGGGGTVNLTQSPGDDWHATWSPMTLPTSSHVEATTWGMVKSFFGDAAE